MGTVNSRDTGHIPRAPFSKTDVDAFLVGESDVCKRVMDSLSSSAKVRPSTPDGTDACIKLRRSPYNLRVRNVSTWEPTLDDDIAKSKERSNRDDASSSRDAADPDGSRNHHHHHHHHHRHRSSKQSGASSEPVLSWDRPPWLPGTDSSGLPVPVRHPSAVVILCVDLDSLVARKHTGVGAALLKKAVRLAAHPSLFGCPALALIETSAEAEADVAAADLHSAFTKPPYSDPTYPTLEEGGSTIEALVEFVRGKLRALHPDLASHVIERRSKKSCAGVVLRAVERFDRDRRKALARAAKTRARAPTGRSVSSYATTQAGREGGAHDRPVSSRDEERARSAHKVGSGGSSGAGTWSHSVASGQGAGLGGRADRGPGAGAATVGGAVRLPVSNLWGGRSSGRSGGGGGGGGGGKLHKSGSSRLQAKRRQRLISARSVASGRGTKRDVDTLSSRASRAARASMIELPVEELLLAAEASMLRPGAGSGTAAAGTAAAGTAGEGTLGTADTAGSVGDADPTARLSAAHTSAAAALFDGAAARARVAEGMTLAAVFFTADSEALEQASTPPKGAPTSQTRDSLDVARDSPPHRSGGGGGRRSTHRRRSARASPVPNLGLMLETDSIFAARPTKIFGKSLAVAVRRSRLPGDMPVPSIVRKCVDYLDVRGLHEEGVYRLCGSKGAINDAMAMFDNGVDVDLFDCARDPHVVAGLLKQYLRDLPAAIAQDVRSDDSNIDALRKEIAALRDEERALLTVLVPHLKRVHDEAGSNKMGRNNLTIVFSSTLRMPPRVFDSMLMHADVLFPDHDTDYSSCSSSSSSSRSNSNSKSNRSGSNRSGRSRSSTGIGIKSRAGGGSEGSGSGESNASSGKRRRRRRNRGSMGAGGDGDGGPSRDSFGANRSTGPIGSAEAGALADVGGPSDPALAPSADAASDARAASRKVRGMTVATSVFDAREDGQRAPPARNRAASYAGRTLPRCRSLSASLMKAEIARAFRGDEVRYDLDDDTRDLGPGHDDDSDDSDDSDVTTDSSDSDDDDSEYSSDVMEYEFSVVATVDTLPEFSVLEI